jgi:RNA polymerase sigma-70 factor (ECF subfamily)
MSSGERFDAALAAAQAGDESGMTALFRSLHPHLLRYLRAKDPAAAEDLASEVWIGVWSGIGSFRGDERAFRAWVFTIAARRLTDHRRRAGRLRAEPGPGPLLTDAPAPDDPAALVTDGLTAQEAVRRMVAGLPPDQAEVLLLRVVADLDVAEVARIMGRTEVSVRVLQHRALKRLSDRYSRKVVTE